MGSSSTSKAGSTISSIFSVLTFFLLGVAYQLISLDPLTDKDQCERDAKQMKDLGANAIRVYHVDPTADHTDCMSAFEDAGIYLFVDLDTFTTQISQVGF